MGSLAYVVTYTAIARNTDVATLAAALAAVPRDVDSELFLGLVLLADVTSTFNQIYARRSLVYTAGPVPFAPDPELGSFLVNQYTSTFSQALSTPVQPSPVVNVPRPVAPLLWVNAQYGVNGGLVATWPDLSGLGHDLLAVAPHQPTQDPTGFAADTATMFFSGGQVAHSVAPLTFDDFTYMLTWQSPAIAVPGILLERSVDASANSGERLYQSAAPTHSILARRSGVVHSADAGAGWGVDGHWHVGTFVYSHAAGGALIVDGTTLATFASLAVQSVSDTLYVGSNSAITLPSNAQMRELMLFPSALSASQIQSVAAYMGAQIGL